MTLINPYTAAWTVINLIVLYLILRKFLFKPVTDFMEARTNKIENYLKDADEKVKEANALKAKYDDVLKNAEDDGKAIINREEKYAKEKAEKIIEDANNEAKAIIERAKEEAETEKVKAMHDLQVQMSHLIVEAASKALGGIDIDDNKIINDIAKEAGATWHK